MKAKPGDIIMVKINGKEYTTVIDSDGVQRFKANSIVRHIVDRYVDLNDLWLDFNHSKNMIIEDMMLFYADMGYSVCGFLDIFNSEKVPNLEINNPLWEK